MCVCGWMDGNFAFEYKGFISFCLGRSNTLRVILCRRCIVGEKEFFSFYYCFIIAILSNLE